MDLFGFDFTEFLFFIHFILVGLGVFALATLPEKFKPIITVSVTIINGLVTSAIAIAGIINGGFEVFINTGSFIGKVPFRIDALAAWFILIINFITTTGIIYGIGYLRVYKPHRVILSMHWIFFLLFQSSMLWVCMIQNSIAFIVAWEIMSVSSMFLVIFEHTNTSVIKAGLNYLVQMHISVIFLTIAFIWVYFKTGTFDFKGIGLYFENNINIWLFLVFFAGFGLKAGFVGMHTWLPHAHPSAPSHISGIMSGVIVKMGIYGILRIITFVKADYIILGEIVLTISVITGLYGIINSAVHRDFKKMLAYCTIENIGLIGIGIGIGLIGTGKSNIILSFLGYGGALLHVLNHSLFKSLLFYSAGSVYQQTHTRDMDNLGGLMKKMPQTALLFLIGAVAIGGIPPLNGFISEFLLYCGLLKGIHFANISEITLMILSFAALSIIGGISILTFTKTFGIIFLGSPRQNYKNELKEVSQIMLIPQYLIVFVMVSIALIPGFYLKIVSYVYSSMFPDSVSLLSLETFSYLRILKNISLYSIFFAGILIVLFVLRRLLSGKNKDVIDITWGCGYIAPTPRIQYTGKSFSKSMGKLLQFIVIEKKDYTELKNEEIFPKGRKYSSHYLDIFEEKIIDPFVFQLNRLINLFKFVQNGKIQAYVLYGILFIIIVFIGTVFNLWH